MEFETVDDDVENISRTFPGVPEAIEELRSRKGGGKVLVHCVAGSNRNVSACIAHVLIGGTPPIEAVRVVSKELSLVLTTTYHFAGDVPYIIV